MFIVAFAPGETGFQSFAQEAADDFWHPRAMRTSVARFSDLARRSWIWLRPPKPLNPSASLDGILEENPVGVRWHAASETNKLLAMMTPTKRRKIEHAKRSRRSVVGALYKRTRIDSEGRKTQRAEVRFDMAGCLRTPGGGSSRQILVVAGGGAIRTRLISAREAARLMGIPDDYSLPTNYNDAYHLLGDGVVLPAVEFIREKLLEPILSHRLSAPTERHETQQQHTDSNLRNPLAAGAASCLS